MSISISGSSYGQQGYSSINVNSKQYEGKYRSAMYAAVKAANPNWQPGQPFDSSILDSVTRELVRAIWYKVAISLSENLLITVFKFMHILRLLFQSVVILPKMELHSNFV